MPDISLQKKMHDYYHGYSKESVSTCRDYIISKPYWNEIGFFDFLNGCRNILDAGCGNGDLLLQLCSKYPEKAFFGVDIMPNGIENALEKTRQIGASNLSFEVRNLESPNCDLDEQFDMVISHEVIEHLVDPMSYIKSINRLLKPGGYLVLVAPTLWLRQPVPVKIRKMLHFLRMVVDRKYLSLSYREPEFTEQGADCDACFVTSPFELWRLVKSVNFILERKSWTRCRFVAKKPI